MYWAKAIAALAASMLLGIVVGCATSGRPRPSALTEVPSFTTSDACPTPDALGCVDFRLGAAPLKAAPGARVYRETWSGPFGDPMHKGSIVLTIHPDGARTLNTPWRRQDYLLLRDELSDFEAALARSEFGDLPALNANVGMCTGGVATTLEAVVDGKYRITHFDFCDGVTSESVAQALDQLFVFAAGLSNLRYPVNPDQPTFRGF